MVFVGSILLCRKSVGAIKMKMRDGTTRILSGIRHIPGLKRNIISIGALDKSGCVYKAQGGVLKVMKGSMVVVKGLLQQGLYVLQGNAITGEATISENKADKTVLWHRRVRQMSVKRLLELGKAHIFKFAYAIYRTKAALEYIHLNLRDLPQVNNQEVDQTGGADRRESSIFPPDNLHNEMQVENLEDEAEARRSPD